MKATLAKRIERYVERAASAAFAGAVGYAAYVYLLPDLSQPTLGAYTGGAGALAYLAAARGQRALQPKARFAVPMFDVREIEPAPRDELVLGEEDRLPLTRDAEAALVLDDVLAELGPDSRVVRLFDSSAMPTAGQLKARIDDHLGQSTVDADASQALSDALAELRRSLR